MNCDYCGNVFAAGISAKPHRCRSCGAGAHWARGAAPDTWALNTAPTIGPDAIPWAASKAPTDAEDGTPIWEGLGNGPDRRRSPESRSKQLPDHRRAPRLTATAEGFRDIDGTWLSAREMLGLSPNFGHKRSFRASSTVASSYREDLSEKGSLATGLFAGGGVQVRREGATGQPVGRPSGGITDEATIDALFRVAANTTEGLADFRWCMRFAGRPPAHVQEARSRLALGVSTVHQQKANAEVMAGMLDCDPGTVHRLVKAGLKLQLNCPTSAEEKNMTQTALSKIDATHALADRIALVQTMHGEALDRIRETVQGLADRFPDDDRIQEAARPWLNPEEEQEAA